MLRPRGGLHTRLHGRHCAAWCRPGVRGCREQYAPGWDMDQTVSARPAVKAAARKAAPRVVSLQRLHSRIVEGGPCSRPRSCALGARPALGARRSALGARRSALGARRSALGARRSALGARRSALGARRSALGARRSAEAFCNINPLSLSLPTAIHSALLLKEVQRILAEVHGVSERQRRRPRRVRIVSVEAVAEKWLVPRLATFKAEHPAVAIELETNHRGVDPDDRNFDAWFAYTGETAAPRPVTSREDTLLEETLEEDLLPVSAPPCSPRSARPRTRPTWRSGRCSTTWDGTPTGRTGAPARASRRRTCRGPRASGCTAC